VLEAAYFEAVYSLFGLNTHLQIAWTCALGVMMACAAVAALTRWGVSRRNALAIAGLMLAFAPADAVRLWPSSAHADLACALFLCGATAAAVAFEAGRQRAASLHAISLALYAISILTYETATVPIALSVLGYRCITSMRSAARRWLADLAIVACELAIVAAFKGNVSESFGSAFVTHFAKLVAGAVLIASWAAFPIGSTHSPNTARAIGAAIIIGAIVVGRRRAVRDPDSRYWLQVLLGALVFAGVCYVTYLVAAGYTPVGRGIANRTNVLSEVGMVAAAFATMQLWSTAAAERWRKLRRKILVACAIGAIGAGYITATIRDERAWDYAAGQQAVVPPVRCRLQAPSPQHDDDRLWSAGIFESRRSGLLRAVGSDRCSTDAMARASSRCVAGHRGHWRRVRNAS
jgi:hypothetical protein